MLIRDISAKMVTWLKLGEWVNAYHSSDLVAQHLPSVWSRELCPDINLAIVTGMPNSAMHHLCVENNQASVGCRAQVNVVFRDINPVWSLPTLRDRSRRRLIAVSQITSHTHTDWVLKEIVIFLLEIFKTLRLEQLADHLLKFKSVRFILHYLRKFNPVDFLLNLGK